MAVTTYPVTDFFLTEPHYADHLLPVEEEMSKRGYPTRVATEVGAVPAGEEGPVVVASYGDLCRVRGKVGWRPVVLMEHGAGQTYSGAGKDAYADGADLRGCALCLVPGPYSLEKRRLHNPSLRVASVGLTKLPDLRQARASGSLIRELARKPTVAFGWHWDCHVCPETQATWPRWIDAVTDLALGDEWDVIGHGHPREWFRLLAVYQERGIRAEPRFELVVERADVYAVDNSSTAFEAVAAGLPVLLLDSPGWDKAPHGLRFGAEGKAFAHCSRPEGLRYALGAVLASPEVVFKRERTALERIYSPAHGGPRHAVDEIVKLFLAVVR